MWCGNTKINHRNGQAQPCLVRSPRTGSNGFGHCRCAASREGYGPLVCSPALQKDPRAARPLPRCPSYRGPEEDGDLSGAGGKNCTCKTGIDPLTSQLGTVLTTQTRHRCMKHGEILLQDRPVEGRLRNQSSLG